MKFPQSTGGAGVFSRRQLLRDTGAGFGAVALSGMLGSTRKSSGEEGVRPLAAKKPHYPVKAKRIIFVYMQGAISSLDTWEYKPALQENDGKAGPGGGTLVSSKFKFSQHGETGTWVSELFPHSAKHVDKLCFLRGLHTDTPAHPQAIMQLHTGASIASLTRPSMGAWLLYGLGTENEDLPGYITINPPADSGGSANYGTAFMPAHYQGTRLTDQGYLPNLKAAREAKTQRKQLDYIQSLNREFATHDGTPDAVDGIIQSYELAFKMQGTVPELLDLSTESQATLDSYGVKEGPGGSFARQCLMARRLSEAGVRFVEICDSGWDHHNNLNKGLTTRSKAVDQPIGALLADLEQRGLLDETLVLFGSEFGRLPQSQGPDGRDHNITGYMMWLAGAGVKPGFSYGATDEFGREAVEGRMHTMDLHATLLALMGLDHEYLTYPYAGRDFRLTDIAGEVVTEIMS